MSLRKKESPEKTSDTQTQVRVIVLPLTANKSTFQQLTEARKEAARVWNACVQIAQYHYFEDRHWISEKELRKALSGQFNLHSQSVQNVIEQYCDNRETTSKLRKQGLTQWKYSWKTKYYFPVVWSYQGIELQEKSLLLKMGRGRMDIGLSLPIALSHVNRVELVFNNGRYYLHCAVCEELPKPNNLHTTLAAIDMGEIHAMAITDGTEAVIITGRQLRSIKQYRAKRLAELQKAMGRCTKYSRRWKKLLKAKRNLLSQTGRQIHDLNHKITRKAVDWFQEHNIKQAFVGDLDGVQRNTSAKKKSNPKKKRKNKKTTQKLSTWEFGEQTRLLKYKLTAVGIDLTKKSEAYTSQECPLCGHRHKPKGRVFKCRCGYSEHRDVVGALNFLRKCQGKMYPQDTPKIHFKYLRPFAFELKQEKVVVPVEPQALLIVGQCGLEYQQATGSESTNCWLGVQPRSVA